MDGRWTSAKGMYTRLTSMEIRHLAVKVKLHGSTGF
jgi:hypothetical protein